jgi:hypothetical protein
MQVVIDCADPARLAEFWAEALPGYAVQPPPPGFDSWEAFLTAQSVPQERWNDLSAVVGDGPRVLFQRVPEPKTVKNRVHLDLHTGGGMDVPLEERRARMREAVARLESLGATVVEEREELGAVWTVMTDPEGNEFCA